MGNAHASFNSKDSANYSLKKFIAQLINMHISLIEYSMSNIAISYSHVGLYINLQTDSAVIYLPQCYCISMHSPACTVKNKE